MYVFNVFVFIKNPLKNNVHINTVFEISIANSEKSHPPSFILFF